MNKVEAFLARITFRYSLCHKQDQHDWIEEYNDGYDIIYGCSRCPAVGHRPIEAEGVDIVFSYKTDH